MSPFKRPSVSNSSVLVHPKVFLKPTTGRGFSSSLKVVKMGGDNVDKKSLLLPPFRRIERLLLLTTSILRPNPYSRYDRARLTVNGYPPT